MASHWRTPDKHYYEQRDYSDILENIIKHIDDKEYDKQLRTYKKYVSRFTNKPIKMYLLAAMTGETREVEDE